MIETYPLIRAVEAYERMLSGKARFRVVLGRDGWPDTGSNATGTQRRAHSFKVSLWHKADMLNALTNVRFLGQSGQ